MIFIEKISKSINPCRWTNGSFSLHILWSNSRNDVPPVAQHRASVLVVFVLFSLHMHSFASLIRRTPPPTFSDTAITDRHPDTTIFQLRAHWVRISWYIGSGKIVRTGAPGGSRTLDFLRARQAPYPLGQALRLYLSYRADTISIVKISKGHNSVKNVDGFGRYSVIGRTWFS